MREDEALTLDMAAWGSTDVGFQKFVAYGRQAVRKTGVKLVVLSPQVMKMDGSFTHNLEEGGSPEPAASGQAEEGFMGHHSQSIGCPN